jgi:uncharacterized membrane protein YgcG
MNKLHHTDRIVVFIIVVIFGIIITGCGSSQQLISTWQDHEVKIDGDQSEWKNALFQVPNKKVFIGFNNDDKFLYLFLKTNDRAKVIQMFRAGFITWFEPENGDYKPFGISFPQPNVFSDQQQFKQNNQGVNSESNPQEENSDNLMDKMIIQQTQLEIVNNNKYPLMALPLINKEGIEVKLSVKDYYFVYQLKVPLAVGNEYSYTAGVKPGNTIKVRFETEKLEMAKKEFSDQGERSPDSDAGQIPRGAGGGGMRGRGGMHSGGRSGGGKGMNNVDPFNYSVEVKLENAPKNNLN